MLVWDLPTRLFHWLLVLAFATAWITAKLGLAWMDWHLRAGYLTATLILFRIVWGFCGSQTSRFAEFLKTPRQVVAYLKAVISRTPAKHAGHNPAGGWMIACMLVTLLVVTMTGLFADDLVASSGPLAQCVASRVSEASSRYHVLASNIALALVALHVLAVALYSLVLGEHLIPAMIDGRGKTEMPCKPIGITRSSIAFVIFTIIAICVCCIASGRVCESLS